MRYLLHKSVFACLLSLFFSGMAIAQTAGDLIGKWKGVEEPSRQTEFFAGTDGFYYARIINDKSKKSADGHLLLKKLKYDEQAHTFKGLMSPPDMNMEINAEITFEGKDKLKVTGKKLIMTKTFHFVRIK